MTVNPTSMNHDAPERTTSFRSFLQLSSDYLLSNKFFLRDFKKTSSCLLASKNICLHRAKPMEDGLKMKVRKGNIMTFD